MCFSKDDTRSSLNQQYPTINLFNLHLESKTKMNPKSKSHFSHRFPIDFPGTNGPNIPGLREGLRHGPSHLCGQHGGGDVSWIRSGLSVGFFQVVLG
jgi:hypothetical protein